MKTLYHVKILIIVLIVSFIFNYHCQAQHIAIGPKVSFVSAGFYGNDAKNIDRRNGYAMGLFANFEVAPFFTIQPEILFIQQGGENTLELLNIRETIKVNYFQVPLLFKFRIPIDHTIFPYIAVGPYASFRYKTVYSARNTVSGILIEQEKKYKRFDTGGQLGLGLDLEAEKLFFNIEARYNLGAINIVENGSEELKNNAFLFNAGVGIKF